MKRFLFLFLFFVGNAFAQNPTTFIPPKAHQHIPTLKAEVARFAPQIETPWYFGGLIEHESCPWLTSPRCWTTESELKNNREHGLGLFQMTRAWTANGTLRFDNLTALSIKYKTHLGEMTWNNYKNRPDLQIRSGILLWLESYNTFPAVENQIERMKFADSSFNGGASHVKRAREICTLTKGCDPKIWYMNVENHLPKSKTPDARYGGRSMYGINVHHVRDVFITRMPKYKQFWSNQ